MVELEILNKDNSFENKIKLNKDEDILKQMINNKIKIFYGCMGGSCGACACSIISGDEFIQKDARKKQTFNKLEKDQFLPCISKIKSNISDEVFIKIKKRL